MVATKLDGNSIAKAIRERLGAEIAEKQKKNPRYHPSLRIIQGTTMRKSALYGGEARKRGRRENPSFFFDSLFSFFCVK